MTNASRQHLRQSLTMAGWVGAMVLMALPIPRPAQAGEIILRSGIVSGGVTLQQPASSAFHHRSDWRTRSRIDRRPVEGATLINPVIIHSEIENSTLVNPVIIAPRHPHFRQHRSTSQPRNPTCVTPYSSLRMVCQ
ncbi:MAG: hypothetical protein IGS38_05805 [Synechococcales cyanobacterium M58_A2018_015]|nr:hypothetical protein [Synechococcales cyanobacterium M58_A2018_015]